MEHGAMPKNIVSNAFAKFDDDQLWNEKALVITKARRTTFVALGDPFLCLMKSVIREGSWMVWYRYALCFLTDAVEVGEQFPALSFHLST